MFPTLASAQDTAGLDRAGAVGLMRHALAPGVGDPAEFDVDDCSTQRNLDDRGRDQARRTGAALKSAGVHFDAIWTSQWCRARHTAKLLDMGPVTEVPALNSFFGNRGDRVEQTRQVLDLLAEQPEDARILLVSHQVNISALTGSGTQSGEILVARRTEEQRLEIIGRSLIDP